MIIEVHQTTSNLGKKFEIYYGNELQYTGAQHRAVYHNCSLLRTDGSILFESIENRKSRWMIEVRTFLIQCFLLIVALIVYAIFDNALYLFLSYALTAILISLCFSFKSDICDIFDVEKNRAARFFHSIKRMLNGYYGIKFDGADYRVYEKSISHFLYLSVYHGDKQIAQICKELHTINNRDNYILYLLDDEAAVADLLVMFILYLDSLEYGNHGEGFVGYKKNWEWTWSRTDRFYNETWVSSNFGKHEAKRAGYKKAEK